MTPISNLGLSPLGAGSCNYLLNDMRATSVNVVNARQISPQKDAITVQYSLAGGHRFVCRFIGRPDHEQFTALVPIP
jgi:hypothetical protein